MMTNPPEGSQISVLTTDVGAPTIVIPVARNAMRYFYAVFLMAWLVGWFVGLIMAVTQMLPAVWNGAEQLGALGAGATVFLLAWIVGWTVGGVYFAYFLFRLLRPGVPAVLKLAREGIELDSGIQPPRFSFDWRQGRTMSDYFPKRIRRRIDLGELKSLRLREFESGSRLTVDVGNARIEIARGATDVECEWLFRLLVDRYQLKTEG